MRFTHFETRACIRFDGYVNSFTSPAEFAAARRYREERDQPHDVFWTVYGSFKEDGFEFQNAILDSTLEAYANEVCDALNAGTVDSFRWDECEAAMCLWEAVLDAVNSKTPDVDMLHFLNDSGYAEARRGIQEVARHVAAAYDFASDHGYDHCFDWEFCPAIIELIAWDEDDPFGSVTATAADELANAAHFYTYPRTEQAA